MIHWKYPAVLSQRRRMELEWLCICQWELREQHKSYCLFIVKHFAVHCICHAQNCSRPSPILMYYLKWQKKTGYRNRVGIFVWMDSIAFPHYGNWRARVCLICHATTLSFVMKTIVMVAEWEARLMFLLCGVEIWTNAIFQTLDSAIIAAQQ